MVAKEVHPSPTFSRINCPATNQQMWQRVQRELNNGMEIIVSNYTHLYDIC